MFSVDILRGRGGSKKRLVTGVESSGGAVESTCVKDAGIFQEFPRNFPRMLDVEN